MNRTYRRIWNRARQCWVVASELAPSRGKASRIFLAPALVSAVLTSAVAHAEEAHLSEEDGQAMIEAFEDIAIQTAISGLPARKAGWYGLTAASFAGPTPVGQVALTTDYQYQNSTVDGDHLVVLGSRSKLRGSTSVAYGNLIEATGDHNVAVGFGVKVKKGYSTAIGGSAYADGVGTVSVGNDAKSYSQNSIAVGSGAQTNASTAGTSRIAIGGNAYAGSSGYSGAIALGGSARAEYDSIALGLEAHAAASGAVAIGRNSLATESNSVSVGSATLKRRIVNVGNARLNATSNDAVTGQQLYATNTRIASVADMVTQSSASSELRVGKENTGTTVNLKNKSGAARYLNGIRNGTLSTTSTDAVTGQQLHATNTLVADMRAGTLAVSSGTGMTDANRPNATAAGALAVGMNARATVDSALALGNGSIASGRQSIALGQGAEAQGWSSFAVGAGANAGAEGGIAFGYQASIDAAAKYAVAFGEKASATHANSVALGARSETTAANQVSVGNGTLKRKIVNLADGALSTSSTEAVTGKQLNATNVEVASVRTTATSAHTAATAAKTTADSALGKANVLSGLVSQVSATGNVRLGAENTGTVLDVRNKSNASRKVTGVADATLSTSSTDAVNGKQLNATNVEVASVRTTATSAQTTASTAKTTADSALGKADVLSGLVSQVSATGNVRLGGDNTGTVLDVRNKSNASRKLTGVADAALNTSSTEAVSGKQLNATNVEVASVRTTATSAQTTANAAKTTADSALGKADVLSGLVSQVSATGNVRLGAENTGTVLDVRNKSNASRKLTGLADATLSTSSTEAVSGKQLNATNVEVASVRTMATSAQTTANAAKTTADNALGKADMLGGLVGQISATGNVRLGGENSGTVLDVRNKSNASRKLTGVADATLNASSTEAVTGKQLFGVDQKVTANQSLLASHATGLAGHETRIADNRRDLDDLRTEFDNFDPDLEGVVRYAADGSIDMDGGKVRGVAAGDVSSAGSTDAVNGGQLFATNQRVEAIEQQRRFFKIGTDSLSEDADAGWFGVAIGESAEASPAPGKEGGTAVGSFSKAMGTNSVALGRAAHVLVNATDGFALGASSRVEIDGGVALGAYSQVKATATNGVALGYGSSADQANTVSVGSELVKRRIVNVGRGLGSGDASTVEQLHEALGTLGGGAGMDASGNVVAPTYRMQGAMQNSVADALTVLDGAVITNRTQVERIENQLRSVFQDSPGTRSDGLSQLNLAGANGMVLGNVANGLIAPGSRDAVNGGQLHAMEQRLDGRIDGLEQRAGAPSEGRALAANASTPPVATEGEGNTGASGDPATASADRAGGSIASADGGGKPIPADTPTPESPTPQVDTAELEKMLARANEYTDDAIKGVEGRLDKMDKRFNRMAAMSSAQTAMAMNTAGLATYNRLGAGVGYAEGESAMAVGYQRVLNEKGSATFSLNGAFTNSGEQSVGLGVGIGW